MRCSVLNCVNSAKDLCKINALVLFHRFPKESNLKVEWIIRCNRQGNKWNPDTSYICSKHFTQADYNQNEPGGSKQEAVLNSWAVPSQNLPQLALPICLLERIDSEDLKEIIMKDQVKISDLTVDELKAELKKRKIAHVGPKVALIKRLKKAITDLGEDPDSFVLNKDSNDATSKGSEAAEGSNAEAGKTEAKKSDTKADSEEEKKEDPKKVLEDLDTPKRALRRSTREKSPAIQTTPQAAKTPRIVKGKKLPAVTEEVESQSKESPSKIKKEESKDKKPKKENVKKETKIPDEVETNKEPSKTVKKDSETLANDKPDEESPKKDEEKISKEQESIVNGENSKSPEKKEADNKKPVKKSIDTEKANDSKSSDKEDDKELDDEDAKQAELELDLEDMEQPDYEEELNFDCGSTFISDNDGDLDEGQDENKSKESPSKKARKSGGEKKGSLIATDTDVSEKLDGGKDTEEEKEKIKSSDKNVSDKEDSRILEKGADGKEEGAPKDLWVTGLSSATKAADLKQAFLKHGKVLSTKIVMNPKMPGSPCFGIVTVASQEDALACVKALNVTELLGRFITVKIIAKKKDKDKKDENAKKRKEDEADKDKSMEKKELTSKKDFKESPKLADKDKERDKIRDLRREREGGIRKRLGPHRVPIRRSPPFFKRRQDMRQQEVIRRREIMERKRAMMDRRMAEEAHRQEVMRLSREREMLRLERERVVREKAEILRLERERIEREKEEIRKQHMRLEEIRRKRDFNGPRDDFDSRPKRPMNERHYDRRQSPGYGGGPPPYRRDDRQGGRFDSRDRYEGGDRRHDGWRDEGRGGAGGNWSGGDKSNNDQWSQSSGPSHDRSWNNNSNKGRGGYNSGPSRGGGSSAPGYNRGGPPGHNMGGQSNMNPYPQPQQHNFNPYPPPKY